MKISNRQTDEFYQLDLYQPNFEGLNGTYGGLFSGGRYGFESRPIEWVTEYAMVRPVELIQEVGPVPPRHHETHENVPDGGTTAILLGTVLVALAVCHKLTLQFVTKITNCLVNHQTADRQKVNVQFIR